jgi:AAA15 family ATPase/GTPase
MVDTFTETKANKAMENENTQTDTSNFLNWVEIKNFKSIKDLRLDCKRVNIFIGKPNVGKSNILEGLGMLGAEYGTMERFVNGYIRYRTLNDLFYDNDVMETVQILTDQPRLSALLSYSSSMIDKENPDFNYEYYLGFAESVRHVASVKRGESKEIEQDEHLLGLVRQNHRHFVINKNGSVSLLAGQGKYMTRYRPGAVKKYDFNNLTEFDSNFSGFLLPPNGINLYEVIRRNNELWNEVATLFQDQKLELVLYDEKQEFILQKKQGRVVWQYPYFSIADTFRRFMFYIAAIESNKNSVLILEEPEVHSFPPYTHEMAERIIMDDRNQYFISTHSPYLLQTMIEKMSNEDLNVFITYYENYETRVRVLTPDELANIIAFSTDIFFNLDKFTPNAQRPAVA